MKALSFLSILILGFTLSTATAQKVKTYKIWVALVDQEEVKGTLYSVSKGELVILGEDLNQVKITPETIETIKLRKQGNVGKGAWIGAVGGAVVGGVAGLASGDDGFITGEAMAAGGVILGAPPGALIGILIGSSKEKYTINGVRETYNSLLPKLQSYAPQKNQLNYVSK